ncbi:replication initiator protein A [Streptobacillus ratti]|uniref:replication initiator protein A n=1 Tax=Streptobacillus ratti TaxID=1720557 RepID=UPI0009341AC0|nr:replication initiator protein A [Streptobacillus ratti]
MDILNETFYQVPKSIFRLWVQGKIRDSTFKVYIVFLERYKISKFRDEENRKYFTFTYDSIMKELNIKGRTKISDIIKELLSLKLIEKKGRTRQANRFYISPVDCTNN